VREAAGRADLVVVTGGLGPTEDDLTRHGVAAAAGLPLDLDEDSLEHIEERFRRHGRSMPARNRIQAMVPQGARVLPNSQGTAPGFVVRCGDAHVAVLPGVPLEMETMFRAHLVPYIQDLPIERQAIRVERLRLFGMPESLVNERIASLMARTANPLIGLLVTEGVITVKLTATCRTEAEAAAAIRPAREEARKLLGDAVFGAGDETLQDAIAGLLERHQKTLAVAESCTGGLVGHYLTEVPGISRVLLEDLVTYSNEAKVELLHVPWETIQAVGAVSEEVAAAMAAGVRRRAKADIGLSTTGIAGPTGAGPHKPVGLVYTGLATDQVTRVERLKLVGDRQVVKDRAAKSALNMLRLHLQKLGDWSRSDASLGGTAQPGGPG
jgi:nicotinamide-nucleotide amidase